MAVQLEVDIKYLNLQLLWDFLGNGILVDAIFNLRDRPLRIKQAVFREQLPRDVVFDGKFLRDALAPIVESLLFKKFNSQGRLIHRYFRWSG